MYIIKMCLKAKEMSKCTKNIFYNTIAKHIKLFYNKTDK